MVPIVAPAKFINPHLYNWHPILGTAHRYIWGISMSQKWMLRQNQTKCTRDFARPNMSRFKLWLFCRVAGTCPACPDCPAGPAGLPGPLQDIRIQEMQQSLRLAGQRHSRNYKSNIQHLQHLHEFAAVNIPLGVNVGLRNFPLGLWNFPVGLCNLDCETCQSDCETCLVKLENRIVKL